MPKAMEVEREKKYLSPACNLYCPKGHPIPRTKWDPISKTHYTDVSLDFNIDGQGRIALMVFCPTCGEVYEMFYKPDGFCRRQTS